MLPGIILDDERFFPRWVQVSRPPSSPFERRLAPLYTSISMLAAQY